MSVVAAVCNALVVAVIVNSLAVTAALGFGAYVIQRMP